MVMPGQPACDQWPDVTGDQWPDVTGAMDGSVLLPRQRKRTDTSLDRCLGAEPKNKPPKKKERERVNPHNPHTHTRTHAQPYETVGEPCWGGNEMLRFWKRTSACLPGNRHTQRHEMVYTSSICRRLCPQHTAQHQKTTTCVLLLTKYSNKGTHQCVPTRM